MKRRSTNPELNKAHDDAWKALKALPIDQEIEKLFDRLSDLQNWDPSCQSLEEHNVRYEAGKPREIWARINSLREEMFKTAESIRWFELYNRLYA